MQMHTRIHHAQATERLLYERADGQNLFLPERSDGLTPGQMFLPQERPEGPRALFIPSVQQHSYSPYHKEEVLGYTTKQEVDYATKQAVAAYTAKQEVNSFHKEEVNSFHKEEDVANLV